MKIPTLLLSSAAGLVLAIHGAQAAGVAGNVNVAGHVAGICAVVVAGGASSTFTGTIDLGELAGPDGKLSPGLAGSTITGGSQSFSVICNSATPSVSLIATTMIGNATTVLAGYTKTIDYTARLDLQQADSSTKTFSYHTQGAPAATAGNLTLPLSGNPNNVTVSVNTLVTNGNLLTAGGYGAAGGGTGGVISVTIAPV